MRAPVDHIAAPAFPAKLPWINVAMLRMDQQRGRPVLIEFWDFCRVNSLRTLPYLKAWHERYEPEGLRVVGVHAAGFPPSADLDAVRAATKRLQITYPVVVDEEFELWQEYGNLGWPARYLFGADGMLVHFHYGEGGYAETEETIQELLGTWREVLEPLRPEDAEGAPLIPQSEDVPGPYCGPYEAGEVWAVLDGRGTVTVTATGTDGETTSSARAVVVDGPGCRCLISHPFSTAGTLELVLGDGVSCHAMCFTPGLAPPDRDPADS